MVALIHDVKLTEFGLVEPKWSDKRMYPNSKTSWFI